MSGRLQNVAATMIGASVLAASPALAADASNIYPIAAGAGAPVEYIPFAAERNASAGATLRVPNGWSASLFVSSFGRRQTIEEDSLRLKASSFVNARLSRNLSKKTRVSFDVFNVFDRRVDNVDYFSTTRVWNQPGAADNFLFSPLEPRGFRAKLRITF